MVSRQSIVHNRYDQSFLFCFTYVICLSILVQLVLIQKVDYYFYRKLLASVHASFLINLSYKVYGMLQLGMNGAKTTSIKRISLRGTRSSVTSQKL